MNIDIIIRELSDADTEEFYKLRLDGLQRHSFSFLETPEEFSNQPISEHSRRLKTNFLADDRFVLGAFNGTALVGMVGCVRDEKTKTYHRATIWGMYVLREEQGKGIGGALLDAAIEKARTIAHLEILFLFAAMTEPAMGLYTSRGFKTYGVEPYSLKDNGTYYEEAMMFLKL